MKGNGMKTTVLRPGRLIKKISISRVMLHLVMILFVFFMALPLIYVIVTAFKPLDELFKFPPQFIVKNPTMNNFFDLFASLQSSEVPFTRYLFNSIFVSSSIVFCTVIVSCMGAFGLVKHMPPGGKIISSIIVASLMFVPQITTIPTFLLVDQLNLMDSYWALILPKVAVAFNFFLIQQFMGQVPDSFLESARLDGASEMYVLFRIVMPTIKPAWATLIMYSFTSNWNDFFAPLIYTSQDNMKTLPLALQTIAGGAANLSIGRAGAVAAATFILVLPVVLVFLLMQKNVMETMAYTGIKS